MNIDNIKSQMRKGMLEFCVLLALRDKPAYSSELISCLKEAKMIVVEGTLYPLLNRLKKEGLLSYIWQESNAGPPRKYYTLTSEGKEVLTMLREAWSEMESTIKHLSEPGDENI